MNMGKTTKFLAAALLAGGMFGWASAAQADPISIAISTDGGSTWDQIAYAPSTGFTSITDNTTYFNLTVTGNGTPSFGAEPGFQSQTLAVTSTGGITATAPQNILIYVTEQNVSFGAGGTYLAESGFTSNSAGQNALMPGISAGTYISNNNEPAGSGNLALGNLMAQTDFNSPTFTPTNATGKGTQGFTPIYSDTPTLASQYSITEVYDFTAGGANQGANVTISYAAVPEPSALLIFGTALLALGGIFWFRRRKVHA